MQSRCVFAEGGGYYTTPLPPLATSVTIYAKTTVHCSPQSPGSSMIRALRRKGGGEGEMGGGGGVERSRGWLGKRAFDEVVK